MTGSLSRPAGSPIAVRSGETGMDPAAIATLILTASVLCSHLIIRLGLPVAHDMVFHLFQADQFHRGIAGGALLPRWALSADNGYGSPNFIFYAPLSYYLASFFRLVAPSPVISLILAIWCSFFLSGSAMYLAVKRISGRAGCFVPAMLYQCLPFHLLNLYARGGFAELCAYVWFPLVILSMHETLSARHSWLAPAGLSVSYAGLIMTHLVSGFMFTLVLIVYPLCHFVFHKSGKALLRAFSALVTGLGISSFYLLPVIFERKYVQMEYLFSYLFSDYRQNFLFLEKNLSAPFYVSMHGAVILELILFLALVPLLRKVAGDRPRRAHIAALCIIFIFAFLLATPLSMPLWKLFPILTVLQFPWRWLSLMELSLCFLVGSAISGMGLRSIFNAGLPGRTALYTVTTLFSVSLLLILKSGRMYAAPFLEGITDAEQVRRYTNLPREYTPVWAKEVEKTVKEEDVEKISILSGNAGIRILEWQPERRVVGISAPVPARLRIATFYYPGWVAAVDGKRGRIAIEQKSGAMLVDVPEGDHTLKLSFGSTPLRVSAGYFSIGACVSLVLFAMYYSRKSIAGDKDH